MVFQQGEQKTVFCTLVFLEYRYSQVTLVAKNPPAKAGDVRDTGSILRLGRSPGERNGYPLQYSYLENPTDRGAWWATVHRVAKNRTQMKWLSMHSQVIPWFSNTSAPLQVGPFGSMVTTIDAPVSGRWNPLSPATVLSWVLPQPPLHGLSCHSLWIAFLSQELLFGLISFLIVCAQSPHLTYKGIW